MRSVALIVVLSLIVAGVAAPVSTAGAVTTDTHSADTAALDRTPLVAQQSTLERTPRTEILIELQNDRSADWRIEMYYELDTENETTAFEEFARRYERGSADVGLDADLFERVSQTAETQTQRSMTIQNTTRRGYVKNGTGVLVLTFTWTNFLEQTDQGLRLGDAFAAGNGETWVTSLRSNQNLTIQSPPGYTVNSTNLPLENRALVIEGPTRIDSPDQLAVTYDSTRELPVGLIGGGTVAAVVLIAGLIVYLRRRPSGRERPQTEPQREPQSETRDEQPSEPRDEPAPTLESEDEDEASETQDIDLDLLSDEERVELLLEQNGGRMKQANIVKETGWSDAKVSQLLSAMADEGRVEKLRLGRENLISLPDEDENTA
ncbi:hypothetical protein C440_07827 [Haloferax mucosum ATCC BAA-1512]|uniref:HTH iclR-type domain-containing protein n=1 Tax=Haloferax mucosum ATCC BAA-1512 TaxID=662479 RepID=M0IGJ8_9EURY|nr:hypothetical protein [Haloferax mucosum]ELZ94968.1 hypothetical protein C440_07827 [Haloferax mucosum ATCC BAA-1512]